MVFTSKESFVTSALRRRYWALAISVVGIVWVGLALALYPLRDADGRYASRPYGWSTATEDTALDLLFQLRDVYRPWLRTSVRSWPITIIEIDEESLAASEKMPEAWRRSDLYARLINRANYAGASVIGLDIFLSEPAGDSPQDIAHDLHLSETIADAARVVIVKKLAKGGTQEIAPMAKFADAANQVGFADVAVDSDGFVRHVPLEIAKAGEDSQFSFATCLAQGYLTAKKGEGESFETLMPVDEKTSRLGDRGLPLRNDRDLQIDFRGRPHAFEHVSAKDILFNQHGQISDDLFRDRIVLIGPAYITAQDQFPTPFFEPSALTRLLDWSLPTAPARTTGVEIHATTVGTILFGQSPVRPRYLWQVMFLIFPLALVGVAVFRLRLKWGLPSLILLAIATLAVSSWAFNAKGWIMPLASAWVGMAVLTPLGFGLRYVRERILHDQTQAERAHIRDILSRCVSKEVADELWQRRDEIMSGERRVVSIIFTDIRGFTTLSETASSDQVVIWLNEYFSRMQAIVTRHCGHINKFLGDGLMIVFGAPISRGDEAEASAAVACGLEMLAEVERLNVDWQGTGRPEIKIGVGITTGDATCGVVGAERRLEYTVIGDVVNLSSRLEATTKEYGVPLLASEATALLLGDEYETRTLGEVKVKGKNIFTKIYTVSTRGPKSQAAPP
jgi:adenylate cyclase